MGNPSCRPKSEARVWCLLIVYSLVFSALVFPVVLGLRGSEASVDEARCYLPAISQLRAKFPAVDLLGDSFSASPPGYTHLLAGVSLLTGDSLTAHRVSHAILSLLGAVLLLWWLAKLTALGEAAVVAALPVVCSSYYLKCSAQIFTDNSAMLLTVAATAVILFESTEKRPAWLAFLLGAVAIYFRHISAWIAGPIILKGLLALWKHGVRAAWPWLASGVALLSLVGLLFWTWGGLVPPKWASAHDGLSFTAVVYSLSLAGLFGVFYLYSFGDRWSARGDLIACGIGALVGGLFFFLSETGPSYEAGRWGGPLWDVAAKLPLWRGRAYVFLPLAAVGGGALALAAWSLYRKAPDRALLWTVSLVAWLSTGLVNRQIFHRYYESQLLGFWSLWLMAMLLAKSPSSTKTRLFPLYILAALLALAGMYSMAFSSAGFTAPATELFDTK